MSLFRKTITTQDDRKYVLASDERGRDISIGSWSLCDHLVVHGSDYAARDMILMSLFDSAIANGDGAVLLDGTGKPGRAERVLASARMQGRETDLFVVDLRPDAERDAEGNESRQLRGFDPFSMGSRSDQALLLAGSMIEKAGERDYPLTVYKAAILMEAIFSILDRRSPDGARSVSPREVLLHLELPRLVKLAYEDVDIASGDRAAILNYLKSLPGFKPEKRTKQAMPALDEHAKIEERLRETLVAAQSFPGVFDGELSNAPVSSVSESSRIVAILFPALELHGDEIQALARWVTLVVKSQLMVGDEGRTASGNLTRIGPRLSPVFGNDLRPEQMSALETLFQSPALSRFPFVVSTGHPNALRGRPFDGHEPGTFPGTEVIADDQMDRKVTIRHPSGSERVGFPPSSRSEPDVAYRAGFSFGRKAKGSFSHLAARFSGLG